MVIDTSAVIAILWEEPEAQELRVKIASDTIRLMAAPSVLETTMVLVPRKGEKALEYLDQVFTTAEINIISFNNEHYKTAREAWLQYGRGRHPASLNFGDCFSYALAKYTQQPLLFKGYDFSKTDLPRA